MDNFSRILLRPEFDTFYYYVDSCESNIYLETEEKECCENKDDCKEDQSCCQKEQKEAETCCPGGICDTKEVEDKVAAL